MPVRERSRPDPGEEVAARPGCMTRGPAHPGGASAARSPRRSRVALGPAAGRDWGNDPGPADEEGDAVSELDRLEAAAGECREMIREAHAATKDLRAAVREAKGELHALT